MSWVENNGKYFASYDLSQLQVDEAYLNITTDSPVYLYALDDVCFRCPFTYIKQIQYSQLLKVSTIYGVYWRLYSNYSNNIVIESNNNYICEVRPKKFGEFGVYELNQSNNTCKLTTVKEPVNIYLPLLIVILCLILLALIFSLIYCTKYLWQKSNTEGNEKVKSRKSKRIVAIDTFRGICIVIMIFLNDGGGGYKILEHSIWNGLQLADLLLPWFMWIMGVCIPLAIKSQLKKGITRLTIVSGIVRRSVILFLLGLLINTIGASATDLEEIRIFGVLQRFSIAYFITAILVTLFMLKSDTEKFHVIEDVINLSLIWIVMVFIVGVHLYFVFYFPVPGCPSGYLGPGGIHYNGIYQNCTGGFTGYIDRLILGANHMYTKTTTASVYHSAAFDPEGIFGTLLSIFQVFLGVQAGCIIITYPRWKHRMKRWLFWAIILGILGLILCQGRQEGGWIPLNKNLWSLSFVAITSSTSFFILTFLNFIIDEQKLWNGAPFFCAGMNAILLFVGHEVAWTLFPWHWRYGKMNTHLILTIEALWGTFLWILISYWLHLNKFYLAL